MLFVMDGETSQAGFERGAAANLWRHTLSRIPTVYGRLLFLASLRDPNSGTYSHYGLAARFGDSEAEKALRSSHDEVFAEWLRLPLARQRSDLLTYLDGLNEPRPKVLETWLRLRPYRAAVPVSASARERLLFCSDLEILLELLRNEAGVAFPDSDA